MCLWRTSKLLWRNLQFIKLPVSFNSAGGTGGILLIVCLVFACYYKSVNKLIGSNCTEISCYVVDPFFLYRTGPYLLLVEFLLVTG